jgi:asparagine synthase (glutamine-hydrolysing)
LPEDHFTGRDIDSLTEELDALLSDSVRMQLRSDVPVGAFLSGGVDSSAIVWHMAKQGVTPRTFTVAFGKSNESAFNEGAFARDVASVVGAEHSELVLDHFELARILERILWFLDEPCATAIPNYFVSQAARSRVTVALSGIGGDELFAGYARYNPIFSYLDPRESVAAYARRFVASQTNFDAHGLRAMLAPEALAVVQAAKRTAVEENAVKHGSKLRAGMQIDVENYLGNDLLPFMDNMSMAHSLEVRVPLLDYRIAEFAARLPDEAKVLRGIRKYLLKRTLADRVPNHVLTREKKGFRLPLQVWLRELKPFVYATLDLARVRRQGLVNPAAVEQALRAYYEAPAPGWGVTYRLWSLLILQLWVERFLEAKPPGTPPEAASKWVVAA